ncbi:MULTISPECIES: hypothetical protein [unclassified Achromobacter]|uniref:hypothetical protein n=1 Tax=unclassified Achromobacter TaxID=2626865 RepID=UPI000B515FBE|nr:MULTISPECIES: hypothetical protein [unclassified Achromobacter]OWT68947.1 hypothetical protein CEY04_29640 [Achromobacter sp. HZ28]OWT78490.1 hypothetical protein CEY05_11410 [Achromobacter sp. HZ34]
MALASALRFGPVLLGVACLSSLAACGTSAASNKKPDIKLNSDARMKYEITATVSDPSLAFEPVKGFADYVVDTPNCVPLTRFTGATIAPEYRAPVELTRVGPNTYRGELTFDLLKDEDYYGQGMCHWTLVAVSTDFHRHKTNFSPALFKGDLLATGRMQRYFSRKSYAVDDMERIDTGVPDASNFKNPSQELFTITLQAKKLF